MEPILEVKNLIKRFGPPVGGFTATLLNLVYLVVGYGILKWFFIQAKQSGMFAKIKE